MSNINLTGKKFGFLTVLEYVGFIKRRSIWKCRCEACGTEKEIRSDSLPKLKSCGCLNKTSEGLAKIRSKKKQTNLERYGVEAPAQLESVRDKMKATTLKRYGVENALQSNEVKEKIKQVNLEKYGVEWGVQNEEIKEKIKITNFEKYGVGNPMQSEAIKEKARETNIERYGFPVSSQNDEIKEKARQTNIIKYGVEWTGQIFEVQEKIRFSRGITETVIGILRDKHKLSELLSKYSWYEAVKILGVSDSTISRYAREHGICDGFRSNLERVISNWLESLGLNFRTDRTILHGKEIDRYCENKKLGIEINGLLYHSDRVGKKDRNYHLWKHEQCKQKGIRLITIWEDEWYDRQEVVKTVIRTQLGLQSRGKGARSLDIRTIDKNTAKQFFENNHIQGSSSFSYRVAAYDGETLVAVMGFGHTTRQSSYDIELKRFCTDGKLYPGIGSRLLKYAIRENGFKNIVSFCDRRYFLGNSYEKMGFQLDGEIPPDYTYTYDYRTRHHKSNFRLSRLRTIFQSLGDVDLMNGKSEWTLMQELGYDRLWDCGKIRYVLENKDII